jgi:hypothetical protein
LKLFQPEKKGVIMNNTTIDAVGEEKSLCCCICKGLGVCYLVCLVSPVVLAAGVAVVALISFFG